MIFKYLSFTDYGRENVERALVRSELRWSAVSKLNDPFDMNPNKTRVFEAISPNLGTPERIADFEATYLEILNDYSVFCASYRRDCPLMWSHYANAHSGLCLHLEETPGSDFHGDNVIYSDERPVVVGLTNELHNQVKRSMLTKAIEWEYERERRFVRPNPEGHYAVPAGTVVGLTLGCKASEVDRSFVYQLKAQNKLELPIYHAVISQEHYRLEFQLAEPAGEKR
jgi:hypothetical protein